MIAIDLNGTIKTFSKLPKVWNDENGTHLNITDGASYGFYPVVTPATKQSERLGDIFFDADAEVFTYPVESRTYTQTVAELKEQKIANLKAMYNSQLAKTDWYIVRESETGVVTPDTIKYERANLRNEANDKEAEINALTTKASVIDYELPSFI